MPISHSSTFDKDIRDFYLYWTKCGLQIQPPLIAPHRSAGTFRFLSSLFRGKVWWRRAMKSAFFAHQELRSIGDLFKNSTMVKRGPVSNYLQNQLETRCKKKKTPQNKTTKTTTSQRFQTNKALWNSKIQKLINYGLRSFKTFFCCTLKRPTETVMTSPKKYLSVEHVQNNRQNQSIKWQLFTGADTQRFPAGLCMTFTLDCCSQQYATSSAEPVQSCGQYSEKNIPYNRLSIRCLIKNILEKTEKNA